MKLKYLNMLTTFQEVPGEISLCINITNCPHQCQGCHSQELWQDNGYILSEGEIDKYLENHDFISCVCFMGGEWNIDHLEKLLKHAKTKNLKTALYSGSELEDINEKIIKNLDYIKTGRFILDLGGLECESTNQRFIDLKTKENLNHIFNRKQYLHGKKSNGKIE